MKSAVKNIESTRDTSRPPALAWSAQGKLEHGKKGKNWKVRVHKGRGWQTLQDNKIIM